LATRLRCKSRMPQLRKKWRFSEEYPEGYEPPAHEHDLSLSTVPIQANDWLKGLRGNVEGLPEIGDRGSVHMEVFRDALLV
jgi:hypothetical protein